MNVKTKVIILLSLLVIGFYLWVEHRVHIFGNAQYLLFALFIVIHLFMHAGHGGHGEKQRGGHHGK